MGNFMTVFLGKKSQKCLPAPEGNVIENYNGIKIIKRTPLTDNYSTPQIGDINSILFSKRLETNRPLSFPSNKTKRHRDSSHEKEKSRPKSSTSSRDLTAKNVQSRLSQIKPVNRQNVQSTTMVHVDVAENDEALDKEVKTLLEEVKSKAKALRHDIMNLEGFEDSPKYYYIEETLKRCIDTLDGMFETVRNNERLKAERKKVYRFVFKLFEDLDAKVEANKKNIATSASH